MIEMSNVQISYGQHHILQDVDFRLEQNQFAYLIGKSGSGKSSLLKLITQELKPQTGEIKFEGKPLNSWSNYQLRRQMGIIFQSYMLLDSKTALENINLAAYVRGKYNRAFEENRDRLVDRVGLKEVIHKFPHQLSGGEQQRVAIVRALALSPQLLLADEPTGNLDRETALEVMSLMHQLQREEKISMLVVTHDMQLIETFPAKVWEISAGKVNVQ